MKAITLAVALAMFAAPALADDTIYDIQNGTIGEGVAVTVEGVIVTAEEGVYSSSYFYAEEPMGGPYSGCKIYFPAGAGVSRGDVVDVTGVTEEYYDETEINASTGTVTIVSSGPEMLPDFAPTGLMMDEQWEGVLVTSCCSFVTELFDYGEWQIDDGDIYGPGRCDDKSLLLTYTPSLGDEAHFAGILMYSYGSYKLAPRDDDDIEFCETAAEPMSWGSIKSLF